MTPEAQRIAIATACGWRFEKGTTPTYGGTNKPRGWRSPEDGALRRNPPDYINDLNAMHEAEKALTRGQAIYYVEHLASITGDVGPQSWLYHATAAQRAEALLRTLNLWKD